jgi:hypothetical protein
MFAGAFTIGQPKDKHAQNPEYRAVTIVWVGYASFEKTSGMDGEAGMKAFKARTPPAERRVKKIN